MMPQTASTARHVQFKNIAVLTDLGNDSGTAVRFAASLARWYGSELTVAHAFAPEFGLSLPPEPVAAWPASGRAPREDAEERTRALISQTLAQDVVSRVLVTESDISGLLQHLEAAGADLLIVATHARKGLRKWLAGSATEEIFRRTRWPVLVLPPGYLEEEHGEPLFRQVLYATDLSPVSATALRYAAGIAEDQGARLSALYVDGESPSGFSFDRIIDLVKLEDWLRNHKTDTIGVQDRAECLVRFGAPAREVLRAADEMDADLIVVGARGLPAAGVASHLVDGTTYEILCTAACPVLVVPHWEQA